jgi:hypothetical protein
MEEREDLHIKVNRRARRRQGPVKDIPPVVSQEAYPEAMRASLSLDSSLSSDSQRRADHPHRRCAREPAELASCQTESPRAVL